MDVKTIAEALLAVPGSWPRASPNAKTAIDCCMHMLEMSSDGSDAATANVAAFAEAGGVRAIVAVLEESARDVGRRAKQVDPKKPVMDENMQTMLMLADLQTMGCTLLSNFAATAAGGEGTTLAELKVAKAAAMVVQSMQLYPDNAEHVEACLAALMQMLPIDSESALKHNAPASIVGVMRGEKATPWLLYLGARCLKHFAAAGAEPRAALLQAGAVGALLHACRAPPGGPETGAEWGVTDVAAKTQVLARAALALLTEYAAFVGTGRAADDPRHLDVNLFLLQDPVVLAEAKCAGVVVKAGEQGIGPDARGMHEVRVEYPEARRGEAVEAPPAKLRLMAP